MIPFVKTILIKVDGIRYFRLTFFSNSTWTKSNINDVHQVLFSKQINLFRRTFLDVSSNNVLMFVSKIKSPSVMVNLENHFEEDIHELSVKLCLYFSDENTEESDIFKMKDCIFDEITKNIQMNIFFYAEN